LAPDASAPEDRALLVAAAEAGGRLALARQDSPGAIVDKPAGQGPVSEADLAVNAALKQRLRAARPDYGWLSEEDPDGPDRLESRRIFVLDPIDGTRAYLAGKPDFAVAVAVIEAGRVIAGAVHAPALSETYAAHLGGGATLNRQPIRASVRTTLEGATATGAKSQFRAEHWPGGAPAIAPEFRPSLALRICLVAAARYDLMVTFRPAWEWDIAAASLIAAESGARVTDAAGEGLDFNHPTARVPGLIIAPPALHGEILARRRGAGAAG